MIDLEDLAKGLNLLVIFLVCWAVFRIDRNIEIIKKETVKQNESNCK